MEGLLLLVAMVMASLTTVDIVSGQNPPGFTYIDCGKPKGYYYNESDRGLTFVSDFEYVDSGEIHKVSPEYLPEDFLTSAFDLRSFPTGKRNCFNITPVEPGFKYRIWAAFMYGNYDGLNILPTFDLYLGVNFWDQISISNASDNIYSDIMVVASSDSMSICLVNTDNGTPFISSIEMRILPDDLYLQVNSSQALCVFSLQNLGGEIDSQLFYPDDKYDRTWDSLNFEEWERINTTSAVDSLVKGYEPPSAVMKTASIPKSGSSLSVYWDTTDPRNPKPYYYVFMHFAELVQLKANETRIFDVLINDEVIEKDMQPDYLSTTTVIGGPKIYNRIEVTLTKTNNSNVMPIMNALEIYKVMDFSQLETDAVEVAAIMDIKRLFKIERNWVGDPCAPKEFLWEGLNCSYANSSNPRIISLNLSSSGLTGEIPASLANLTKLEYLDLTGNNFCGPVPDSLQRKKSLGTLIIRIDSAGLCDQQEEKKKKRTKTIVIGIAASVGFLLILSVFLCFVYRRKITDKEGTLAPDDQRKTDFNPMEPSPANPSCKSRIPLENGRFTYSDLIKMTGNFSEKIGSGAFGSVFLGVVESNTRVAVKMLSGISFQGPMEFQTAISLSKTHHKNLVHLVGYCSDPKHLALVYEYMEQGSLDDHLSGKTGNINNFCWKKRLQVAIGAAQGLYYLHDLCETTIIHRDVKTKNILLDRDMEAKIADFGLSKIFERNLESFITTAIMGTPGYLDPEYASTQVLNKKSDVYGFGVVLLQLVTGQPALYKSHDQCVLIADLVRPWFERRELNEVVDKRLGHSYNIDSIEKTVEIALACTSRSSANRPYMDQVLMKLKDCLALEPTDDAGQSTSHLSMDISSSDSLETISTNQRKIFGISVR